MKSHSGIKSGVEVLSQKVHLFGTFGKWSSWGRLPASYFTNGRITSGHFGVDLDHLQEYLRKIKAPAKEFREIASDLKSLQLPNRDPYVWPREGTGCKQAQPRCSTRHWGSLGREGGSPKARSAPPNPHTQKHSQAAQTQPTGKKIPNQHHFLNWGSFQNCLKSEITHLLDGKTVRWSPEPPSSPQQIPLAAVFALYILPRASLSPI